MAKALVKCLYCDKIFDRNAEPNIKIGRRYAHIPCKEEHDRNLTQEEKDEIALYEYVKILFGKDYNYVLIRKQITEFYKQGYSYNGMRLSLKWFYEIQHHSTKDSNGVGIIPYVFEDARKYFYTLYLAKISNSEIKNYKPKQYTVTIPLPQTHTQPIKLWNLEQKVDTNE